MVLPDQIGVMTLQEVTLFPQSMLPLYVFEPRYRRMLEDSLKAHRLFCVAQRKPGTSRDIPAEVAGLGLIRAAVGHGNGTSHMILQGLTRVRLDKTLRYKPYRVNRIEVLKTPDDDGQNLDSNVRRLKDVVTERLDLGVAFPSSAKKEHLVKAKDILNYLNTLDDPGHVADMVACSLLPDSGQRQVILETVALEQRLNYLVAFLIAEIRRLRADMD
jgi:Lon protease-like protein